MKEPEPRLVHEPRSGDARRVLGVKTMRLALLLVNLPLTHPVLHSLIYYVTTSSGVPEFPELVIVGVVDGVTVGSCNSDINTIEGRQTWSKKLNKEDPHHLEWRVDFCRAFRKNTKTDVSDLKRHFHQTGGIHVLQRISGCDWDVDTGDVDGFQRFGYDGEDFVSFHVKNTSWVFASKALTYQQQWVKSKSSVKDYNNFLIKVCPQWLKTFLNYGNSSLQRKVPPSVSLLRQSPSSPVCCHATGFYPDRAQMFWRKDGEEIHENVDQGEILPNQDGTFQMKADLNISADEDWSRYECVFQLSGVVDVITKLNQTMIRTNWVPPSEFSTAAVVGVILVLLLLLSVGITGCFIWRKNNTGDRLSFGSQNSNEDISNESDLSLMNET